MTPLAQAEADVRTALAAFQDATRRCHELRAAQAAAKWVAFSRTEVFREIVAGWDARHAQDASRLRQGPKLTTASYPYTRQTPEGITRADLSDQEGL